MNAVIKLIEQKRGELTELCHRYGVERLYLFGSATAGRFQQPSSDLDFIVEMTDRQPNAAYVDRYLGLAEALERLFGRLIDLITDSRFATHTSDVKSRLLVNSSMDTRAKKLLYDHDAHPRLESGWEGSQKPSR